ncbi:MAG: guanylate kinase [Bacteroidales bacterium]
MDGKMVIVSAPSGAGKTTIVSHITGRIDSLGFSVSATTREPRRGEIDGKDYYFMSGAQFRNGIEKGEFVEWEEVYSGHFYGTLRSEIERLWAEGRNIIFDVDVKGGLNLKRIYSEKALAIFIMPPSVDELEKRLRLRGKDCEEKIRMRVDKAIEEIGFAPRFDQVIINDDLETTKSVAFALVTGFLNTATR